MYRKNSISVVVPAYNEELLIMETITTIPDFVDKIVVINDGSTDDTMNIVQNLMEKDHRITLINKPNGGLGSAVSRGIIESMNNDLDIVVVMDGDNQMNPDYLPALLNPIVENRADHTKGNRLTNKESTKGMSKWRLTGNHILTLLTKISSGYWNLSDPQNGYNAFKISVFDKVDPESIHKGYGYTNDILAKMNNFGFRIENVPIPAKYGNEKSKIKYPSYIYRVSLLLLTSYIYRLNHKYFKEKQILPLFVGLATMLISFFLIYIVINSTQDFLFINVIVLVVLTITLFLSFFLLFLSIPSVIKTRI